MGAAIAPGGTGPRGRLAPKLDPVPQRGQPASGRRPRLAAGDREDRAREQEQREDPSSMLIGKREAESRRIEYGGQYRAETGRHSPRDGTRDAPHRRHRPEDRRRRRGTRSRRASTGCVHNTNRCRAHPGPIAWTTPGTEASTSRRRAPAHRLARRELSRALRARRPGREVAIRQGRRPILYALTRPTETEGPSRRDTAAGSRT